MSEADKNEIWDRHEEGKSLRYVPVSGRPVRAKTLTIPVDNEAKVAWRLTGEGDVSFRAIGPRGQLEDLKCRRLEPTSRRSLVA